MKKKILIIENDAELNQTLFRILKKEGFKPYQAHSLNQAYELLEKHKYDFFIVDRMLGDGDGVEIVEYLHQVDQNAKIIIISEKKLVQDRVLGLKKGADDYLVKPFSLEELKLKIHKLSHIVKKYQKDNLYLGQLIINKQNGLVNNQITQEKAQLRKRELQILKILYYNQNQIVSRDNIINQIWQCKSDFPLNSTIDVYVRRLRMKLGNFSKNLETVRGFGYRLRLDD